MRTASIRTGSATRGKLQSESPTIPADRAVEPDVTGFYEATTGSVQYVVADPLRRKAAIIDPVLDFDPRSGSTRTTSADTGGSPWNGSSTPIRMQIIFLPPVI